MSYQSAYAQNIDRQHAAIDTFLQTHDILDQTFDSIYGALMDQDQHVEYNVMAEHLRSKYNFSRPNVALSVEDAITRLVMDGKGISVQTIHEEINRHLAPNMSIPRYEVLSYMHHSRGWMMDRDARLSMIIRDVELVIHNIFLEKDALNIDSILSRLSLETHPPTEVAAFLHDHYGWDDGWNNTVYPIDLKDVDRMTQMLSRATFSNIGNVTSVTWHGKRHDGHVFHVQSESGSLFITMPNIGEYK